MKDKLKDNLAIKGIVALGIALSPALLLSHCQNFRNKIILSWDTTVEEYKKKIKSQLDCIREERNK